jgi:hypothetical protein
MFSGAAGGGGVCCAAALGGIVEGAVKWTAK